MDTNYIDIVKILSENYNYISIRKEYKFSEEENAHVVNRPCFYLNDVLTKGTYTQNPNKSFHKIEMIESLSSKPKGIYLDDLTEIKDNTIVQIEFHPSNRDFLLIKNSFFDKVFIDFPNLLNSLKTSNSHLILYFGFEADSFQYDDYNKENYYKNYYQMLEDVISENELPNNSIILLSSNGLGNTHEKIRYGNNESVVKSVFDNFLEWDTFLKLKGNIDLNYNFETHIDNLKKSSKYLLRVNRTSNLYRDLMLYYLFASNNIDKCLIEHIEFGSELNNFKNKLNECRKISDKLNYTNITDYFNYDNTIISDINKTIPLVASTDEQINNKLTTDSYGIEPIPHDIYHNSIFSWVSTSLVDMDNQVFINSSTFNPILYYHPLLIHGNKSHISCFKNSNYKSFSFLFDEDYDLDDDILVRFVKNVNQVNKLLELPKDILIDIILSNRNILEYNRNLLFECNSIERILTKFYNLLNGK